MRMALFFIQKALAVVKYRFLRWMATKLGFSLMSHFEEIKKIVEGAQLDIVQLHGNETNEVCVQSERLRS